MSTQMKKKPSANAEADANALSEPERRKVFFSLVDLQDQGVAVQDSRRFIAGQYGLTPEMVRTIEEEGMEKSWPPL